MTDQSDKYRPGEALVVVRNNGVLRVYSPSDPSTCYEVSGNIDSMQCTCPDFQFGEPRCRHIIAALDNLPRLQVEMAHQTVEAEERLAIQEEGRKSESASEYGTTQMLLKRSVSPDGKIDSLSVEFSSPVNHLPAKEIKSMAFRTLLLQSEIVKSFLGGRNNGHRNGNGNGPSQPRPIPHNDQAMPARMIEVGGMDGKWGRRLFIVIESNAGRLKLFGSARQLEEFVRSAGFPEEAADIYEGKHLDIPCRILTQPSADGRFLNVEKVLPAQQTTSPRRFH